MSGKHRKTKHRRTQEQTTEGFEPNEPMDDDDPMANLNQLIVRHNDTSYDPRYMDMGGKRQSNSTSTHVEQGSLFRNCAMAIAANQSQEAMAAKKETFTNVDCVPPVPSRQNKHISQDDLSNEMICHPKIENPMERPAYNAEGFEETVPVPQHPKQTPCNQPRNEQPMPQMNNEQQPNNMKYEMDYNATQNIPMNIIPGYTNGNIPINGIMEYNPLVTHRRPFNKYAFRVSYGVVIGIAILLIITRYFLNSVRKHKQKLETENKNTTMAGGYEEYKPNDNIDNENVDECNEDGQRLDRLTIPDKQVNEHIIDINDNENLNAKLIKDIETIKSRQRDSRGRFVKNNDSLL